VTVAQSPFPFTSRYHPIEIARLEFPDGREVPFVRRRFLPPVDRFQVVHERLVTEGDRLDNVTAQELGDPEQFWRLCDANNAMRSVELEEVGRRLLITLPEGLPGSASV
jgi:hypothetical protein